MSDHVLFTKNQNGVGEMTLNRPRVINSLTYDMLEPLKEKLQQWENDPDVKIIILKGAGEKGFCAGGDMKTLYEAGQKGEASIKGKQFFSLEYEVDQLIDEYSKPIIACLDGIVMGGGVGLTYGASQRIVTERTKWAMPEMNIGFFPDVGAAYFLNQAPGYLGRYLALTSTVIHGADVMFIHAADHFMKSDELTKFIEEIKSVNWHEKALDPTLKQMIDQYASQPNESETIKDIQKEIDHHFRFDSVEEIIASLKEANTLFASETLETLQPKSPVSLKVTLKQLVDGQGKSFAEALVTDLVIANHFMEHPDFFEGVRSVLIDKDHNPSYKYKELSDVSDAIVNQFFD